MKTTDKMKNTENIGIDLFEDYTNIPAKVQTILDKYEDAFVDGDYKQLEKANKELNKIGYTFEYYLDGQAYDLRPIGTKGKSEMDEFKNGGNVIDGIEIPYEIDLLLKEQQILNNDVNLYSKQLNELPKNEMNLITDDAKKSNKYKEIKFKYDAAFNKLQNFGKKNTKLLNNFLKKIDRRVQQNIRLYYKNIAYKLAKGGSLDKENSDMVLNNNKQIAHHTKELANAVNKNKNIPAWVVAKINRSATDISDATHYLEGAKYKKGGDVEKSIRGFKVGDDFYKTPSESGETRYYKITSIDDFNVKADDYDYVRNGTDVKTNKKSSFTNASFDYGVSQHKISRYDRGDFGYSKGGNLQFCYSIGGL